MAGTNREERSAERRKTVVDRCQPLSKDTKRTAVKPRRPAHGFKVQRVSGTNAYSQHATDSTGRRDRTLRRYRSRRGAEGAGCGAGSAIQARDALGERTRREAYIFPWVCDRNRLMLAMSV